MPKYMGRVERDELGRVRILIVRDEDGPVVVKEGDEFVTLNTTVDLFGGGL